MKLKKYDNKLVRIICIDGKIYEGIATYNSRDYSLHEFGKDEESIEIFHFLFYKDDIKKVCVIDKFSEPFGEIEISTANDIDLLEQALDIDEDDIHVYRLLTYLESIKLNSKIIGLLENIIKYSRNEEIVNKTKEILKRKEK